MKWKLPVKDWSVLSTKEEGYFTKKMIYDFPNTMDIRDYEAIALDAYISVKGPLNVSIRFVPILIGRPEFFPYSEYSFRVLQKENVHMEISFSQFSHKKMVDAFLKYISQIEIIYTSDDTFDSTADFIQIEEIALTRLGKVHIYAQETSKIANEENKATYLVHLDNESQEEVVVSIGQSFYGRETIQLKYEKEITLKPLEKRNMLLEMELPNTIPAGGYEKATLFFTMQADASTGKEITFLTSKKTATPFLLHTQDKFHQLQQKLKENAVLQQLFEEEYRKVAKEWSVPTVSNDESFVYPAYSQIPFSKTAIAWKLTQEKSYEDKVIKYLEGFLDEKYGYLSTKQSYFVFIESTKEYDKGDHKVRRACSAGWVQEAEFFIQLAIVYDLFYDNRRVTRKMHETMKTCMKQYMEFVSWRLGEGDGNNFQIAEIAASLYCAYTLQDYVYIKRFFNGRNGFRDILGSVLYDDGIYFEEASGYMRLTGELFFDIANASENFGFNIKNILVPAAFDTPIIHSPWALRSTIMEDRKPFLGMSFDRFVTNKKANRSMKQFFDGLLHLLTKDGILFSINDSNEQNLGVLYEKAYYLYQDKNYLKVVDQRAPKDLLFGIHMVTEKVYEIGSKSFCSEASGLAVLRENIKIEKHSLNSQAVLKFGGHGGYHGHFDHLSLVSYIKENETFHNMEYAWFGYDSFLFKMWVQASMAHNMVVVDGKMQEPTPCKVIFFQEKEGVRAVCAETYCRWSDVPYGGQTPYPVLFPEDKCIKEGHYVLPNREKRRQGEIGTYTNPILQRRMLVLIDGFCLVWDYLEAKEEHIFDCLYHPKGKLNVPDVAFEYKTKRFFEDPYGAGQFVTNCGWYRAKDTLHLHFENGEKRVNQNDIIDFAQEVDLYRLYPTNGEVMLAQYPKPQDSFLEKDINMENAYLFNDSKKVVSFRKTGKTASFVTALEISKGSSRIQSIHCKNFETITIIHSNGKTQHITVKGLNMAGCERIEIQRIEG